MHQLINKKKIYFYLVSFLFLSTFFNHNLISNFKHTFKIDNIKIENNKNEIDEIILFNTSFLLGKNILFINKKYLSEKLYKLNFIESVNIKKKYPSTIKIKAKVTSLIATTHINQKKYYVGLNGNFILAKSISNQNKLPIIFGKFDPDEYILLQRKLINQKINLNEIIKYYHHKNKRWDLHFKNNIIIQLPNKNISKAITLYKKFKLKNEIASNTIIDLRIQNRLILRNE